MISVWAGLALKVKRFHDRGRSGWWLLTALTGVGIAWLFVELGFLPGDRRRNRFGEPAGTVPSQPQEPRPLNLSPIEAEPAPVVEASHPEPLAPPAPVHEPAPVSVPSLHPALAVAAYHPDLSWPEFASGAAPAAAEPAHEAPIETAEPPPVEVTVQPPSPRASFTHPAILVAARTYRPDLSWPEFGGPRKSPASAPPETSDSSSPVWVSANGAGPSSTV